MHPLLNACRTHCNGRWLHIELYTEHSCRNCTVLMTLFGMHSYINTVIPGCIGAGRTDRISHYFFRSLLLVTVLMVPMFGLQLFSGPIMHALGVHQSIADSVGQYTRLMIITSWLMSVEQHLATVFVNLGYTHFATFNSLVTGCGIDLVCSYMLVYRWNLGVAGAAYTQIAVKACRIALWLGLAVFTGHLNTIFGALYSPERQLKEPLLSAAECRVFLSLAGPNVSPPVAVRATSVERLLLLLVADSEQLCWLVGL